MRGYMSQNTHHSTPPLCFIPFHFPNVPNVACAFQMRYVDDMAHSTSLVDLQVDPMSHGNISLDIDDDKARVRINRERIAPTLGIKDWAEVHQVHGDSIHFEPEAQNPHTASAIQGDALATSHPSRGLMIKTADCQPVLLAHTSGKYVAGFHVGWRGNRIEFLQSGIKSFCDHYGIMACDLVAVRGPSLGPDAAQFTNFSAEWGPDFAQWFCTRQQTMNLWQLTRDQLCAAGLDSQSIYGLDLCTLSLPQAFFSYRRERNTGRQASFIWIRK